MPGTSAAYNCIPPIPSKGRIASERTIIPIPPIHCVNDRQKSNPCGNDSISVRIDAPVVVNPDMVSKKASVKEDIEP